MKNLKPIVSLTLAAALTATLAVGALAAEETEPLETIEVSVDDLMAGYDEGMADHLADTLRPVLAANPEDAPLVIAPAPQSRNYSAGQYDITVNGATLDVQASVMVPLRKVAEAMGYTVTWHGDTKSVTVETGKMHTEVVLGRDLYFATTSMEGMVGMTAPFSLGVPPYCVDGVTYVPLGLFEVLEGNVEGMFTVKEDEIVIDTDADKVGVVIVSVEEKLTEEELNALLKKYNMTVLYDYQNFNMYAFRLEKALDRAEMAAFCEKLEGEDKVLSAEPDQKMELMDGGAGTGSAQ